jgi:hypothetical protein
MVDMYTPREVEKVVAEGTSPAGDHVELVHCTDGTYGIRTGEEVLSAYQWPDEEVSYAVTDFLKMTRHAAC